MRTEGGRNTARAALALALMLMVPLLELWAANSGHGLSRRAMAGHLMWMSCWSAGLAVLLRLALFRLPLWRILVALVPVTFLFFAYGSVASGLAGSRAPPGSRVGMLVGWGVVVVVAFWLGLKYLRTPRAVLGTLIVAGALLVIPAVRLVATAGTAHPDVVEAGETAQQGAVAATSRPNIYWLVADGYPRGDVLREEFGFDNSAFEAALEQRGIQVARGAVANYPLTFYSVASMAAMEYVVDDSTPTAEVRAVGRFTRMAGGDNRLVRELRALGYRYVHFTSGYEQSTLCSGVENLCIIGSADALDEIGIVLLRRTPLLDLGMAALPVSTRISRLTPFSWRGFDALEEHLVEIRAVRRPFLLYAHIIDPHPPLRHNADCSIRPSAPDLMDWSPEQRPAFVAEIQCVNRQLGRVLDRIIARDPDAIVVVNGDHGSAFRNQFAKAPAEWDAADVKERFSTLLAIRVPVACRPVAARVGSLVNVFRAVTICLTHRDVPLLPDRQFVTAYNDSPHFGKVVRLAPHGDH
jgi:hypothetical protein